MFCFWLRLFVFNSPTGEFTQPYMLIQQTKTSYTYCLLISIAYFFFLPAAAGACPGFGRFAPYLERL